MTAPIEIWAPRKRVRLPKFWPVYAVLAGVVVVVLAYRGMQ